MLDELPVGKPADTVRGFLALRVRVYTDERSGLVNMFVGFKLC